jgi:hypothetical protein
MRGEPLVRVRLDAGHVLVRELKGADERAVAGTDAHQARCLVDRLLVDAPGVAYGTGQAAALTVAERDRVLVRIYDRAFGDRVAAMATCPSCEERYDLEFSMGQLVASVQAEPPPRSFRLPDGTRGRVPTGEDETAVSHLAGAEAVAALLARCVPDGDHDEAEVSQALEDAAPVLELELDGVCPECGAATAVPFSVQRWLLGALLAEQGRLLEEVHILAQAYGWGLAEIMDLSRSQRRGLVALAEGGR